MKKRGRRNVARLAVLLAMSIALVGVISSAQATPQSEDAEAVANALESFADRLGQASDALGEYQDLADSLPLTDLSPGEPGGLNLSNLLDDAVGALGTYTSMADLAAFVETRDGTYGGVAVQFGAGTFSQPAVSSTVTSITVPVHATRTVSEPLDFEFGPTSMDGGSLAVDFVLDTTLSLTVDPSQITDADTAPGTAVSLAPPTINLCANATGSVGVFTARFGFTDLKVSTDDPSTPAVENATLHACAAVTFTDPDSTGGITADEWSSHALTELASAQIIDAPGTDLATTFYADASLIDGDAFVDVEAADASIAFNDADLSNGFNATPAPTLGALGDWDNIDAGDVANGLAQFVASLAGSQSEGDGPLPFLKSKLSETFQAVKPLTDYAALLTNAEVGCGPVPGDADSFPTGLTDNLQAGTPVYCRARAQSRETGSVSWSVPAGTPATAGVNTSGASADATLGADPSADAVFTMTAPGNFTVEVAWDADTTGATDTRRAIPRPGTAQELFARLASAAGLNTGGGNLNYSSATKSLTLRLQKDNFDPPAVGTNVSFGDLLRNETNLGGLQDVLEGSASTSFTADVSDVDFDVTFGVLLLPDTSDITPLRGSATASSGTVLTDGGANFLTGPNAPRLAQVVKNTTDGTQCTIAAVAATTLTCATPTVSWDSGDAYDVDGGLADRFFVKVDNSASEAELSVGDINIGGTVSLTGKVGFLEVKAGGNGAVNTKDGGSTGFPDGTAFGVMRADNAKPVVRVDIKTPDAFMVDLNGSASGGEQPLTDTIGVADLLFHLDDAHLDAVCNLKATAGLGITAEVDGTELASGGVSAGWPTVFKAGSCEPDFSTLEVDADGKFNANIKDFDLYPSVSGVHNGGDAEANLEDTTKDFDGNAVNGGNLLNLTLHNKTTGASCKILTLDGTHLNCTLSGGTRSGDEPNKNKWKNGDEYETEGNALALLSIILDHLDELVEQVDQIAPGQTDKQIPLIGISTKELVAKIQSLKQTIDELRGSPLAEIDCTKNPDGTNPTGFSVEVFPDSTTLYCRAVSTIEPDSVVWTAKELVGAEGGLTVTTGAFLPGAGAGGSPPVAGNILETIGPDAAGAAQDDRVEILVTDGDGTDPTTSIDEWQVRAEYTDAAGTHTVEFPSTAPPQTLQDLEKLIGEKLGVPNVLKLDLLDLPAAGAGPITTGAALGTSDTNTLQSTENFTNGTADPVVGNTLFNLEATGGPRHCTITEVAENSLECGAAGIDMDWGDGDDYEIVGDADATKDLIVRLGFGVCSADDAGSGPGALCKTDDADAPALTVPLNTDLGAAGDLVTLNTEGDLSLDYAVRAQLDVAIPLKLDLTPDVVVLDTTKAEVEGRMTADGVGLDASIGPVEVQLGTAVDLDGAPDSGPDDDGTGVAKLGAELSINKDPDNAVADNDDAVDNNRTFSFGNFFGDLDVTFQGADPDLSCQDTPAVEGDACAVLDVAIAGILVPGGPLTVTCTADPLNCVPVLPSGLQALLDGAPLNWGLLLQILPQLLTKLEGELDGAAKDVHIPLIGDTLDAGADIVGTFNDQVVTPFADLAAQITASVDDAPNGDGDLSPEPWEVAKKVQSFIFDGAGTGFSGLGPAGADLLLDLNASGGPATIDDVVVTPLCTDSYIACEPGHALTSIKDLRIAFLLGDDLVDADVPFDIGLRGLPIRLSGGVASDVGWSVFVDFGLNKDGPYLRTSGPKSFAGGETGALPNGADAPALDTGISGAENKAHRPPNADGPDDDDGDGEPDGSVDPDELPNDAWSDVNYLQDDQGGNFGGNVEPGMWLYNLDTGQGCRIYSVELNNILRCDDPSTTADEGITWHQTTADGGQSYAVIELHPPDEAGGGKSELNLSASVGMGTNTAISCTDVDHDYSSPGEPSQLSGFSADRCLAGELAFLAVTIRDKNAGQNCDDDLSGASEDPTALCLALKLDLTTGDDRVTVSDLISGDLGLAPSLTGQANIDVRFRTGLNVSQSAGFPSVVGKFHLYWGFVANTTEGLDFADLAISFDAINLDAGKFISQFLQPIVKQVKKITGPLMPVVELVQGEIPIISDLSKLVGEGPVTVLDVLEAVSGNDLSLLRSILQFVRFVNTMPGDGDLLIPLGNGTGGGSFAVSGDRAGGDPPLPEEAGEGITNGAGTATNLIDDFAADSDYGAIDDAPDECAPNRGSTFGVCGLTFPFLGDASQIFGVLMGKDATLVRYDAGTFGAGAGFGFCFPPILIGPVPVQICIGGSFRVEGRFAIGYDTSGLRKVLAGGTGTHLLDGIFLDDYDVNKVDVPEVKFIGTVYAEGAVSVYIFKVGIRGEIIFTTELNLHEDDPKDGKLRIEEIISRLANPLCLFDVTGRIEAALSAFVEIDLYLFTKRFSIEIVRITLLEFDLDVCTPEPPNLARVEGEVLFLHLGNSTERAKRNVAEDEIDEIFTVRQMESYTSGPNSGKTRFSITAYGIQEDEFLTTTAVNNGTARLVANAHDGDDTISLLPGSNSGTQSQPNQQNPPVPFKLRAELTGGNGNDELTTGDGNDDVQGDDGNDRLITGPGADKIRGGSNDDKIDAGEGNDTDVQGGDGLDNINGGKGADILQGNGDDDVVSAGPDNPAATSVDDLRGGGGNDTLTGDGGNDKLYGDEVLTDCTADGTDDPAGPDNNSDVLIGADGADEMYGGVDKDQLDGGNGDDTLCGGGGRDEIVAGAGQDDAEGGGGDDNIAGGTDNSPAASGGDVLNGGAGRDYIIGDEGTLSRNQSSNVVTVALTGAFVGNDSINGGTGDDFMWGQAGTDAMNGNENDDELRGGLGVDTMNGNADDDEMYGEDANDVMHGDAGNDYMRGGVGIDTMDGDGDTDEMYGDNDADVMRGGDADDLMRGGGGDDEIEGNGNTTSALPLNVAANPLSNANSDLDLNENLLTGAWTQAGGGDGDVIYGDAGEDDIVGGSQGASPPADDGDTIFGNAAQDVILGDNGDISRPGGSDADGTTTRTVSLTDPNAGGGDYIQGNDENDDVYAGGGGDLVHGDLGDDYVEGNGGSDGDGDADTTPDAAIGLYGDTGQDDLIGGTSQGDGGAVDGADDVWGGQGEDVIAGDNADITRTGGGACDGYVCNTFRAGDVVDVVIRRIQMWDVDTTTSDPAAGTSSGDTLGGQDGHDRLYGQGGDDAIEGGGNDDFAFGNAGADVINGNDGQDDLVGGTGRTDSATAASATDGRADGADVIQGQADFDAISGDNSRMVRQTQDADASDDTGFWTANTFNNAVDRLIALMDVGTVGATADASTSGNDQLLGGAADDVVYGQGGNDGISGGEDQDLLEGNANGTGDAPDPVGTYGGAWPTFAGDVIHGDAGADDIGGGTGRIYRMVAGVETQDPVAGVDGRLDGGDTIFGDGGGDALAGDNTVIERALVGGQWILDDLHSPDALAVVRRVMRQRDVATTADLAPLTNGTSGADTIYGNDGVDVAYGQGGEDVIQGNAGDDHLEGSANDDTITGNEGRDDIVGGTGRTFSNDEATAAAGRIDNPAGDDAPNDVLHGGDGLGGVASDDDDVIAGDNATIDRTRGALGSVGAELNRLPFNGAWGEATWDEPNILRVVRLLDVATTASTAPETNATNGEDTIDGEANEDVLFGQGGNDAISGDDADLDGAEPADAGADDYIEGNGGADLINGNLGEDDITGGGSASHTGANGLLDANRDGTFDPTRSGETLRDGNDLIAGDNGDGTAGDGDVIAGDNARIQRLLDGSGDWRIDAQRGVQLRDVFLFDIELVGSGEPGDADPGESGADTISGNGGEDILLGQANGSVANAYGTESGAAGSADCQTATGGPGSGTLAGTEEAPNGDDDGDDLPDLNDPQCRVTAPGDSVLGEGGEDYIEGNQGSDNVFGGEGEDDVIGGSSANTGHLNVILPPADRDAGFAPGAITDANTPFNLLDGHDVVQGNAEDDLVAGDNAFADRYSGAGGVWLTLAGPGTAGLPATPRRNEEPERGPWAASDLVRRDVTTKQVTESAGAFGNDFVQGGTGKDDVYGLLGNDWLEGNEDEDAIVGDMGKIVNNQLGGPTPDTVADPLLTQFITPEQPFLGSTINYEGILKREVRLYAFDESQPGTVGIGHDVALGGDANDAIHTGPGEDLANGNAGDDRIWLGDNFTATTAVKGKAQPRLAHDRVDAGWGGSGHDHLWGGYGADYLDVRPRSTATTAGLTPTSDPETWFQVAGKEASHNTVLYDQENFEGFDYVYGGWDQDAMQANEADNGPIAGDRLLDWSGVYNAYYVCPPTYGDWVITRAVSPGMIAFLQSMSQGFGATETATRGESGFRETAIVFPNEHGKNANPIHPDTPAHFTCGPGVTIP
ncbi:MAG: hypothetical protein M3Q72_02360 [Actinomycetota bacterium]|nr:hypothetical protein [Actinomycetota bacterium]